jgi:hypothetical protein
VINKTANAGLFMTPLSGDPTINISVFGRSRVRHAGKEATALLN